MARSWWYSCVLVLAACGGGGGGNPIADARPSIDAAPSFDGRVVINEIVYDPIGADTDEWVELRNDDTVAIDIGRWRLCGAEFQYYTLPESIVLPPDGLIVVHWNVDPPTSPAPGHYYTGAGLAPLGNAAGGADKSMAIYTPQGLFDDPLSQRDFVQWIEGDQARADVAAAAGRWATDEFVAGVGEGASICYLGNRVVGPARFAADATPTPLAPNAGCESEAADAGVPDATPADAGPDAAPPPDSGPDATPPPPTDGDVIVNEVVYNATDQWIEIKNADSVAVDVSGWWLCNAAFQYVSMPAVVLDPGALIVVHWNATGTQNSPPGHYYTGPKSPLGSDTAGLDQQVALYHAASFTSSTEIRDYMQWLVGTQARSDVAANAGIWATSDFVAGVTTDHSLCYNGGSTTSSSGFSDDPSPTPLAENGGCN